jgi:hypothetical protein
MIMKVRTQVFEDDMVTELLLVGVLMVGCLCID